MSRGVFGLRLALWYATLFVAGADRHRLSDLLRDGRLARAARSADHPVEARRVRDGLRARRPAGARRHGSARAADGARAAVRARRRSRRGGARPEQPGGLGSRDARDRVAAAAGRHARPGREEHRGAAAISCAGSAPRSASSRCRSSPSRSPAAGSPRSRRCSRFAG